MAVPSDMGGYAGPGELTGRGANLRANFRSECRDDHSFDRVIDSRCWRHHYHTWDDAKKADLLIRLLDRGRWDLYFELSANNRKDG